MHNQNCRGVLVVELLFLAACRNTAVQGGASADTSSPADTSMPSAVTTPLGMKRVVGLMPLDRFPDLDVVHAPASVAVNHLLTVTVLTYGSSSCTSSDGDEVDVSGLTATITPFDVDRSSAATTCTADLAPHPHTVQFTFHEHGAGTMRVIGQNFDGVRMMKEVRITITP